MTWTLSYCTLDRSPMYGLPETLEAQVRAAARVGFAQVTPDIFSLRAYRDSHGGSVGGLRAVLDDVGAGTYDLSGVTISDDADTTFADVDEFIVLATELDATWIQSRVTVDTPATRAIYTEAARRVVAAGFGFAFEYSPFVPISSLAAAAAFIAEVAREVPRQVVIIDTWHFDRTGDTLDDLRALDPAYFGYIQLDDAVEPGPDMRYDTLNRRTLPGTGNLALREFLEACHEKGFDGVLSVEVLNEDLRRLDVDAYVARVWDSTQALLAGLAS
jgi:sugar phosphate isomerase/epimerase